MLESFRKRFSGADATDKGVGAARIKSFTRNVVKTLDEAKPAIIEQLKLREAIDLQKKVEADKRKREMQNRPMPPPVPKPSPYQ